MAKDVVEQLVSLLRSAEVVPRLDASRVVRSTRYDPFYRACTVLLTLAVCSSGEGKRSLNHQLLRLYEFVAVNSGLVAPLEAWVKARVGGQLVPLEDWATFPSGYAGETMHEAVVTYLLVSGEIVRDGTKMVRPEDPPRTPVSAAVESGLDGTIFQSEVATLRRLRALPLRLNMLAI